MERGENKREEGEAGRRKRKEGEEREEGERGEEEEKWKGAGLKRQKTKKGFSGGHRGNTFMHLFGLCCLGQPIAKQG